MNIVEINAVNYGSTGNIMLQIAELARSKGHRVMVCCPKTKANLAKDVPEQYLFSDKITTRLHFGLAYFTGLQDCFSVIQTLRFLKRLESFKPDVIHLHNLHSCYINLPLLFRFIKKRHIRVIWTLHDCWSFTGRCPYFDMNKCDRWKSGCHDCPHRLYPKTRVDSSRLIWRLKKKWFTGVEDMTIVTPSRWLAGLVKQSFLSEYPVRVINNGIDLEVFKPTPSDFRAKHGLEDKHIVLGVAAIWGRRKGLDVFIELARRLDDSYKIVLVGTDDEIDRQLPDNIISIHRTSSQRELAEIYTASDVFVTPTREDNYPTVNMEAIACGIPVISFRTGGSPEMIGDGCGAVVDCDDVDAMEKSIITACEMNASKDEALRKKAADFDRNSKFEEYIRLYDRE